MTIGEKIKKLRREQDVTQEKLAAYLKISSQSVSKWETGNATPEISLLVPLANFFGVTTDELLGRDAESEAADLKAYDEESRKLHLNGDVPGRLELWRRASEKYPKNYDCMMNLADALYLSTISPMGADYSHDEREKNAFEAIGICERVLEDCTDSGHRNNALQTLVFLYGDSRLKCADEAKAVKYALTAASFYTCREVLLESAFCTEEGKHTAKCNEQQNILRFTDEICRRLTNYRGTVEERIFAYEMALRIWNAVIYDGNYLFYYSSIADIYAGLARAYASLGNREKTIENVRLVFEYAKKYDALPLEEQHYTSIFVSEATCEMSSVSKNYTGTYTELGRHTIQNDSCFDFIRNDPEFAEIMNA